MQNCQYLGNRCPWSENKLNFDPWGRETVYVQLQELWPIAIFGHETWPLAKVPEVAHIPSFYSKGVEIELIFALRAAGQKLYHKLYISFLNYPQVPNFTPFCSTAGHFQDIGNFAFFHGHNVKFQSFFKKFVFKISKFQEASFVCTVTGNIQKKFGRKRIKIHSRRSSLNTRVSEEE